MVVVRTSEPEVPVRGTLVVPVAAVAEAVKVRVEVALPFAGGVTGLVEKAAVTPLGRADRLSGVAELKPFTLVSVLGLEAFEPRATLTALAEAAAVRPGVPGPPPRTGRA